MIERVRIRCFIPAAAMIVCAGCGDETEAPRKPRPVEPTSQSASVGLVVPASHERLMSFVHRRAVPVQKRLIVAVRTPRREILALPTRPHEALAAWRMLHENRAETGFYPVVILLDDDLLKESWEMNEESPEEILAASHDVELPSWFAEHRAAAYPDEAPEAPREPWVEPSVYDGQLLIVWDHRGRPREDVAIALIPCSEGHEVPAHLPIGGWNEHPAPEAHVAVLRYWRERHGAELASMTSENVELWLPGPIEDRDVAMSLAVEHHQYCEDCIEQGVGSIDARASDLMSTNTWYFWWD